VSIIHLFGTELSAKKFFKEVSFTIKFLS